MLPRSRTFRPYGLTLSVLLVICATAALRFDPAAAPDSPRTELLCRYFFLCADAAWEKGFQSLRNGSPLETSLGYFKTAVLRDEASPARWCDLGDIYVAAGNLKKARSCFLQARSLAPNSPIVELRSVNFYLHSGDSQAAVAALATLLKDAPRYENIVFSYYQRLGLSVPEILKYGLPVDSRAATRFFHRILAAGKAEQALDIWRWICSHSLAGESEAIAYVDGLIKHRQYATAAQAWQMYLPTRAAGSTLVLNGGFEEQPAGLALDWDIQASDQAQASRDCSVAHSGQCSLSIHFDARDNLTYHHVSQTLVIPPGTYEFQAFVRAQDVTTDQGIRFHLFDPENPSRLQVTTDDVTGNTDWFLIRQNFTVPEDTHVIEIQVYRSPSQRFENRIKGTIWLDEVSILPRTV